MITPSPCSLGQLDSSIAAYTEALTLDPAFLDALVGRDNAYMDYLTEGGNEKERCVVCVWYEWCVMCVWCDVCGVCVVCVVCVLCVWCVWCVCTPGAGTGENERRALNGGLGLHPLKIYSCS